MKTLSLFLLLVCASFASAQTVPSSCDAPDSVKELYRIDAALAVLYVNHPFYNYHDDSIVVDLRDSVIIYSYRTDTIVRAMLAVRNALPLLPRDSVGFVEDIHQHHRSLVRRVVVEIDTGSTWGKNLYEGKMPTGNAVVDSLFSTYKLFVDTAFIYGSYRYVVEIASEFPINGQALIAVFKKVSDVRDAHHPYDTFGSGDYITYSSVSNTASLIYSLGWGDCPSGCTERRFWQFTVFPDCSVMFDSSYGDPLTYRSVYDHVQKTLSLYPNPVTDKLIIEAEERGTAIISDVNSKEVRTATLTEGKNELVVRELASGMYFITLRSRDGSVRTGQFIKL